MKELLVTAAGLLDWLAKEADTDGLPDTSRRAAESSAALLQLAETADLRDELWEAALARGRIVRKPNAFFDQMLALNVVDNICRKVAETDTET
jgi:hypothetical protein